MLLWGSPRGLTKSLRASYSGRQAPDTGEGKSCGEAWRIYTVLKTMRAEVGGFVRTESA
jgi:hypothetical protein